jgi:diguanylate cyclase (GGDEF)-like protein
VAKRLQNCMRESDTASRLGGDEFVALLSEIDNAEAAMLVANKILAQLTKPYEIAGHSFDISASVGIAIFPWHGLDGKSLMKQADLAMYDAKNSGRSNVKLARGSAPAKA